MLPPKCAAVPVSFRVISKLLVNSLNSYLACNTCYDFSLFLSQKGFESNTKCSLLIEGSNSSAYGQRHGEVWVILRVQIPEKPRHVMATLSMLV